MDDGTDLASVASDPNSDLPQSSSHSINQSINQSISETSQSLEQSITTTKTVEYTSKLATRPHFTGSEATSLAASTMLSQVQAGRPGIQVAAEPKPHRTRFHHRQ